MLTMLTLSRKKTEEIYSGDDIRIVVIDIRQGVVRLGIEAPDNVSIKRKEVYFNTKHRQDNKGGTKAE
jgi:carbon storage regulator